MAFYPNYNPYYQQNHSGLTWVQGEAGAKSYPVSAGQSVLLMDSESNSFFIKTADASGMPLPLRVFDYTERRMAVRASECADMSRLDTSTFVTREEFETRLAAISGENKRGDENAE